MKTHLWQLDIHTDAPVSIVDITRRIKDLLEESGVRNGLLSVSSAHTTTAITVNEYETRLLDDLYRFFARLVPADQPYRHNDIHLRDCPPDEPKNAHSHICAMLYGNSEVVPVNDGSLGLGRYQSIMLVELDGPRERTVNVQFTGE
jgi:secondary thiamine-phosphate synthase enzyme